MTVHGVSQYRNDLDNLDLKCRKRLYEYNSHIDLPDNYRVLEPIQNIFYAKVALKRLN